MIIGVKIVWAGFFFYLIREWRDHAKCRAKQDTYKKRDMWFLKNPVIVSFVGRGNRLISS